MRISERQIGYVVAVALSGRLRGWKAARILDECFRRHAGAGIWMLVADLAAVSAVDTVGLDAMIRGCQTLRRSGTGAVTCWSRTVIAVSPLYGASPLTRWKSVQPNP